ncbi:glycosyltransferase [Mycobacterium bohemicum DSM 44277]|uniref:Glycosyl transferase n=2 Tax=Mycobacterium bohemicum TaxID=56425 RepID=A0A1X1R6P9_MYCBE|nr:glycosyltransferase [Mycobacterium bohemicum]MCV6969502.1 glycosyltransferase [Mycobacterium bohemicum]ORV00552.1 glycosyl transferase [Mycobacterium bohemicum]CPR08355.1 glycosyltransferase [Mycobacterium bohemicum DSM 44277]
MKFALASCGTRGDVEPCAAVGLELLRRGHDVVMAAPPDQVGFVEGTGLAAVPLGPPTGEIPDVFVTPWRIHDPIAPIRDALEHVLQRWADVSDTLKSLAAGADLLFTGVSYQESAANVAEYYGIPVAAWHHVPMRPNGHLISIVPPVLLRSTMRVTDWAQWRVTKRAEDAQRRELGLPEARTPASRRMAERGSLELQAYDALCFPGLAREWAGRRPFVGALTAELPTDFDDEVASWIASGTPPVYFGFGSMPVKSPSEMVDMIVGACAELGERALICSGATAFTDLPASQSVKVVRAVSHSAIFPTCRAVVHHGGAGTTAAGMRAGVPTLILWVASDQPIWSAVVKRLKVGTARRFSRVTRKSLVKDLRRILAPEYQTRARQVATRMTKAPASVAAAADLLEAAARGERFG